MSEAMSSVEIEDVLSSIRRLVSEDLRPGPKPVPTPKPDEKLLLTSAFRVVAEKEGKPVKPEPVAPRSSSPMPRLHLGAVAGPDELVFRMQRTVEEQQVEWESEVGDPAPLVAKMEWTEDGWAAVDGAGDAETAAPPVADVPAWAQTDPDQDAETIGADGDDLGLPIRSPCRTCNGPTAPRQRPWPNCAPQSRMNRLPFWATI